MIEGKNFGLLAKLMRTPAIREIMRTCARLTDDRQTFEFWGDLAHNLVAFEIKFAIY